VLFYTECAVPVLISAVLTAHLSGELTALPRPPGWILGREEKGKRDRKETGRGKEGKGRLGKERAKGKKRGKQGKGKERKGRREEEGRNFVQL